jgi:hypothetical protein
MWLGLFNRLGSLIGRMGLGKADVGVKPGKGEASRLRAPNLAAMAGLTSDLG